MVSRKSSHVMKMTDFKNEDNLKNEDVLKHEENLKNEDDQNILGSKLFCY